MRETSSRGNHRRPSLLFDGHHADHHCRRRRGTARRTRPLDRRLETGGPGVLGGHRRAGRPAQPGLLDPLRARRLLHLEHVVGLRAVPRPGVRLRPGPEVPADNRSDGRRRRAAHPLHVRRRQVRRPQLDDRQRRPAAGAGAARRRGARAGRLVRDAARRRRGRRRRRRQLLVVDGEHRRVLPPAAEGLGARPQRRRRQHRRRRRAARRPRRAGHGRAPATPASSSPCTSR